MQWWQQAVLAVAAGGSALVALVLVVTAVQLRRLRFQPVRARVVADRAEIPDDQRRVLDAARAELLDLGFAWCGSEASDSAVRTPQGAERFADIWRDTEGRVFALVARSDTPEPQRPFALMWFTLFADGRQWLCMNRQGHFAVALPASWQLFDDYLPDDAQALARHRERVAADGAATLGDTAEAVRRITALSEQSLPAVLARGGMRRLADGTVRMGWRAAMCMACSMQRGQWRAARARLPGAPAPGAAGTGAQAAPVDAAEADAQAFERMLALQRSQRASRETRLKWLAISALAFVVVGMWWSSWRFAAILLAVIALHEGGHWLAMKASGFRNLSVFFVPGLGGLATGEKPAATPFEKLLVYLAGPVPGLALAIGLFWALPGDEMARWPWLHEALLVCLVIKYLNLLPITPLDGGRVVETFLFANAPRLRFVFALASFSALAALGLTLGDPVLLAVAVLIGLALPLQWRVSRLAAAVPRGARETLDEPAAIRRLFGTLHLPRFAGWPYGRRMAAVQAMLPELQGRRADLGESIVGLAIYAACLAAPIGLALEAFPFLGEMARIAASVRSDDVDDEPVARPLPLEQRLQSADALPVSDRIALYLEAAQLDPERAAHWQAQAWALAEPRERHDAARAEVLLAFARAASSPQAQREGLERVLSELQGASGATLRTLAQAEELLAWEAEPAERLRLRRQALHHSLAASTPHGFDDALRLREAMARTLDALDQAAEAEALLRQNIALLVPGADHDRSRSALTRRTQRVMAQADLAWFLLDHGRAAEAHALALQAAAALPAAVTASWIGPQRMLNDVRLWSALAMNDRAAIGAAWAESERALAAMPFGGRDSLVRAIDRTVVAEALGDAAQTAQARDRLAALAAGQPRPALHRLCEPQPDSGDRSWRRMPLDRRARQAAAQGLCAAN